MIAFEPPCLAAVEEQRRILRVRRNRCLVIGDGAIEIAKLGIGLAAAEQQCRIAGLEPDGLVQIGDRGTIVAQQAVARGAVGIGAR